MIVWFASYPRSGNTYYRMLIYKMFGVKTYSVYNDPLFEKIGVSGIIGHETLPAPIEDLAKDKGIYFVKTHDLPTDSNPAVYLVRDGRDSLVSLARYIHSFEKRNGRLNQLKDFFGFKSFRRTLRELIVNFNLYGGWSNNVLSWTSLRESENTFVIRFEDLVANPNFWLKKSLEGLHIQLNAIEEDLPSFSQLHNEWPKFFRKGKIGSWREEMPSRLHELFWMHHANAMEAFGYPRN